MFCMAETAQSWRASNTDERAILRLPRSLTYRLSVVDKPERLADVGCYSGEGELIPGQFNGPE